MRIARRIELLPQAVADLNALPEAIQDQVIAKLELLREFPEMGPAMIGPFTGWRSVLAARKTYRVVYRLLGNDVIEVAWIRHCARRPPRRPPRKRRKRS